MRRCALLHVAFLWVITGMACLWFETGMLNCRADCGSCVLLTEWLGCGLEERHFAQGSSYTIDGAPSGTSLYTSEGVPYWVKTLSTLRVGGFPEYIVCGYTWVRHTMPSIAVIWLRHSHPQAQTYGLCCGFEHSKNWPLPPVTVPRMPWQKGNFMCIECTEYTVAIPGYYQPPPQGLPVVFALPLLTPSLFFSLFLETIP